LRPGSGIDGFIVAARPSAICAGKDAGMKGLCGPRPAAMAGQLRAVREFTGAGPPDVTACKSPIGLMFPNLSTAGMKMSGNTGSKFKACGSPLRAAFAGREARAAILGDNAILSGLSSKNLAVVGIIDRRRPGCPPRT
jgi:hypothetical protein